MKTERGAPLQASVTLHDVISATYGPTAPKAKNVDS